MNQPLKSIQHLIAPQATAMRGTVVRYDATYLYISTPSGIKRVAFKAGYIIGQPVLLNADGTLNGKAPSGVSVPVYIV